jgi:hypothetical protein
VYYRESRAGELAIIAHRMCDGCAWLSLSAYAEA